MWTIWVGIAFICLVFAALVAWMGLQSYRRTIAGAQVTVERLAQVLEEHASRSISSVDMLLQSTLFQKQIEVTSYGIEQHDSELIGRLLHEVPQVKRLSLMDLRTGQPVARFLGSLDVKDELDRKAWEAHAAHLGLTLHIGDPTRDAESADWRIGISRRRSMSHGESYVAVAHVSMAEFQRFFDALDIGRNGSIVLFRDDGRLIARRPFNAANVGRSFGQAELFEKLKHSPAGIYQPVSVTDGVPRIAAYRRVGTSPLVVVAALSRGDILDAWRKDIYGNIALLPLAVGALAIFGLLLSREARRRDEAEAGARDKSALFEATLDNMDQGLIMFDAAETVQVCNARAIELLDLPPEFVASKPSFLALREHQIRNGEFARSGETFKSWVVAGGLEQNAHVYERERPNGTVLEVRTVPLAGGGAVRTFTDVTARKHADRRIAHMARHDALTNLPNRTLFRERLEGAVAEMRRSGKAFAVLCLDLDLFKAVNDTLGHSVGDALLVEVSRRIRQHLRGEDLVARIGGDEFVILQTGGAPPGGAEALASRLVETIGQPFHVCGHDVNVGATIGIALAPADGHSPDKLLKSADLALYRAKAEGRGTFRFFEPEMDAKVQARRSLELDLREALARGEFELHYQPFMDVASSRIVGFEALLRWNHARRGLVSPAEFIPVAEETGLIVPLGEWVLRRACAEAATWPKDLRIAVNVSAAQFRTQSLAPAVIAALGASGLLPSRLELEITETVLMRNTEASLKVLHQLRELGVRIAMDDFGTGYSSLSYLRSFPVDKIKIDRSFVKELGSNADCAAIVRAILSLGSRLGISTTAEGVETENQLEFMRSEGCTEVQGYLLSAPKPAREALEVLPGRQSDAA